ncbi:hypothetical protein EHP00_1571 [Ecytonucleospora hepatopenaei]|uniref:OTU domain-containing protein n=1 Tax=Ecytonucleospora hepatopenaei TaxID=646526 RepID=A0A1W0E6V5_9MICR|nr:hypothetical protein EHP00_1571 [Ecytonucleospora hepatopenaei]
MKKQTKWLASLLVFLFSLSTAAVISLMVYHFKSKTNVYVADDLKKKILNEDKFKLLHDDPAFAEVFNNTYENIFSGLSTSKTTFNVIKNDLKKNDFVTSLRKYILKEPLIIKDVRGDGACFYHAVLYSFFSIIKREKMSILSNNKVKNWFHKDIDTYWRNRALEIIQKYDRYVDVPYKESIIFMFYFKMIIWCSGIENAAETFKGAYKDIKEFLPFLTYVLDIFEMVDMYVYGGFQKAFEYNLIVVSNNVSLLNLTNKSDEKEEWKFIEKKTKTSLYLPMEHNQTNYAKSIFVDYVPGHYRAIDYS